MTKKSLAPFFFENQTVRVIERDGEPWFVLNDVCAVLEIANPRDAAARLDDYEKGVGSTDTLGGAQPLTIINESGLYSLTLTSRKPAAKAFKRWVTTEVLPSIRKYGFYDPAGMARTHDLMNFGQHHIDGRDKTYTQRFQEERERFERTHNTTFASAFKHILPASAIKVLDRGDGGIIPILTKDQRWLALTSYGFDLLYIMFGHRTLTDAERAVRDAMRASTPEGRETLLQQALQLPQAAETFPMVEYDDD